MEGVTALTDVTGFGLLGHLSEICEGSDLHAVLDFDSVPVIPEAEYYLEQGAIPGGTLRNFESYGHKVQTLDERQKHILCDPQTSGGLLIAVRPEHEAELLELAAVEGYSLTPFGYLSEPGEGKLISLL
jgi:selenide,water dikinase